jgi:hypothetical protein
MEIVLNEYRNSVCEIRKGEIYTKASNRGRKRNI